MAAGCSRTVSRPRWWWCRRDQLKCMLQYMICFSFSARFPLCVRSSMAGKWRRSTYYLREIHSWTGKKTTAQNEYFTAHASVLRVRAHVSAHTGSMLETNRKELNWYNRRAEGRRRGRNRSRSGREALTRRCGNRNQCEYSSRGARICFFLNCAAHGARIVSERWKKSSDAVCCVCMCCVCLNVFVPSLLPIEQHFVNDRLLCSLSFTLRSLVCNFDVAPSWASKTTINGTDQEQCPCPMMHVEQRKKRIRKKQQRAEWP